LQTRCSEIASLVDPFDPAAIAISANFNLGQIVAEDYDEKDKILTKIHGKPLHGQHLVVSFKD